MNIIVLCGGLSTERDVSIKSGALIAKALRENGHRAVLVDVFFGYEGEYSSPEEIFLREYDDKIAEIGDFVPDLEAVKKSRRQDNESRIGDNVFEICRAADIVFMGLHGADGEDGRLQAAFDLEGIRYTGCGYFGSALAMDKNAAKTVLKSAGILVPQGKILRKTDTDRTAPVFPCVVKPNSCGSSVGTSIAQNEEEFRKALDFAFSYDDTAVIEEYIKGREIDVGVLAGKVLPPIEICPKTGFFDYKNKYQDGMTDEYCPCDITEEEDKKLRDIAKRVFDALQLEIYARMDFIMRENGDVYCLEANTLPGMTPNSLMPKEAKVAGISYNELCETILTESLKRYSKEA